MHGPLEDPRKVFGMAVTEAARKNERINVLSTDSGFSSGFREFAGECPDRYYELGIMEQAATSIACGLSLTGHIPVFCAIAPFVTCRSYEMFRNDLGYMRQNAKIVGRNSGFTYSDLGATHHSLEDFAIMRMVPGVVVLAPQDAFEIRDAVKVMLEYEGPVYMRIGNQPVPGITEKDTFVLGRGKWLRQGDDLVIISTGSSTANVLEASMILERKGIRVGVIGMPTISPIDREIILKAAAATGCIMTVEEHYREGGLGTMVAEICAESYPVPVHKHGVPQEYATTGSYEELLAYYRLDAGGIALEAEFFLNTVRQNVRA